MPSDRSSLPSHPSARAPVRLPLEYRHFLIGVTGGIAAYKTCELVRRLQDLGATVQVVMTEAACEFVSALTFQALSGRPVYVSAWPAVNPGGPDNGMAHIDLSREADAILVAPASADFIAKLAHGQANDLLSTLCLARENPLIIAPAMNRQMWQQPATQRNIEQLRLDGVQIWGPASGAQACGEIGDGRMLEPEALLEAMCKAFDHNRLTSETDEPLRLPNIRGVLQGRRVVVTAGPTFEPIDPVRGITNRSSGKMGFALAQALQQAGAEVHLISGPVSLNTPTGVMRQDVTTAQDMFDAATTAVQRDAADIFVGVAAVADWRPAAASASKMKKDAGQTLQNLSWIENPDILATIASLPNAPFCVGFAAESGTPDQLSELLPAKRARKNVPLLVGNIGPETFGADHNQVVLCTELGLEPLPQRSKTDIARMLVFRIAQMVSS